MSKKKDSSKAKKAQFPTLEQLYDEDKKNRKMAAKTALTQPTEDAPPQPLHFDENVVRQKRAPKLRVVSPSRMMSKDSGLLKFKEKGNGYRKAAKFLLLLNKNEAAEILKQFEDDEVEKIIAELSTIKTVDPVEAEHILQEFHFIKARQELPQGGMNAARNILVNAFGEKKGREILQKTVPIDPQHKPFEFLEEVDDEQIYHFLKAESELVLATIIPFLSKAKGSKLLQRLDSQTQVSIARRIAKLQQLDAASMQMVEIALRDKIHREGRNVTESRDGSAALANILKYMDLESEQEILDDLERDSIELSNQVKEKIFTIDMIVNVDDVDLQKVLVDYTDRELAVIIKGKSEEVEHKILNNVSANRAVQIQQERVYLGAVKKDEVDEATKAFLNRLRRLQIAGEIFVKMPGEEWV